MTASIVTSIDVPDIQAIEFECGKCHTKMAVPIKMFNNPPIHCSVCPDSDQWLIPGSEDHRFYINLAMALKGIARADHKLFTVRFQIATADASRAGA